MSSPTRTLNSGHEMPLLGLGTWKSKPNHVGAAIKHAILNAGYRHIDCAAIYQNEPEIGTAFSELFGGQMNREDVFVTSKLWNTEHHPDRVEAACKKTLSDLQLEYLDLYLIHWALPEPPGGGTLGSDGVVELEKVSTRETWEAMQQLVKKGLVKSIGVSNFTTGMILDMLSYAEIMPAVNQVELHVYNSQPRLVDFCHRKGIAMTAYSPLGRPGYAGGEESKPVGCPSLVNDEVVKQIAAAHSKQPCQVLLRFLVQQNIIVIPKSVTPAHIDENAAIFDFELSDEQMQQLAALDRRYRFVDPAEWWGLGYFD